MTYSLYIGNDLGFSSLEFMVHPFFSKTSRNSLLITIIIIVWSIFFLSLSHVPVFRQFTLLYMQFEITLYNTSNLHLLGVRLMPGNLMQPQQQCQSVIIAYFFHYDFLGGPRGVIHAISSLREGSPYNKKVKPEKWRVKLLQLQQQMLGRCISIHLNLQCPSRNILSGWLNFLRLQTCHRIFQ
jgi:hypothetical protein